jgi:hypothetical protein
MGDSRRRRHDQKGAPSRGNIRSGVSSRHPDRPAADLEDDRWQRRRDRRRQFASSLGRRAGRSKVATNHRRGLRRLEAAARVGARALVANGKELDAAERASLEELYGKALEGFDRSIVTISGGALAISVTFVHEVAPNPVQSSFTALWIGWIGLALSLSFIVVSMLTGHKSLEDALEGKELTGYTGVTTFFNIAAAAMMVGGLLGLAWFAQDNMFAGPHIAQPARQREVEKRDIERRLDKLERETR